MHQHEEYPPQTGMKKGSGIGTLLKMKKHELYVLPLGILCCALANHIWIYPSSLQLILPVEIVIFFWGMQFGPWVGLISGGIGTFLDAFLSIQNHYEVWAIWSPFRSIIDTDLSWKNYIASALVGCIAGIVMRWFRENLRSEKSTKDVKIVFVCIGIVISSIVIFLMLSFDNITDSVPFDRALSQIIVPTIIFNFFLLPILMLIYYMVSFLLSHFQANARSDQD